MWKDDPSALFPDGRPLEAEIHGLLEFYICHCIPYGPNNVGGWWSDGVLYLEIDQIDHDTFKLLGVTDIGCKGVAPFEIDVMLDPADDDYFAKTVFRIGLLDDRQQPLICDRGLARHPRRLLSMRPIDNSEWAMAAELTPPPKCDRTKA